MNDKDPMNIPEHNDYLWNGTGAPDPEIQRLESLLADFRHDGRPLAPRNEGLGFPVDIEGDASVARRVRKGWFLSSLPLLAAAAVILFALAIGFFSFRKNGMSDPQAAWDCAALAGSPEIGSRTIPQGNSGTKLRVGQTITTNSTSRASLWQDDLGEIQVDPNTRVRLVQSSADRKRINLELGTIHAAIWAPPTQFVVETPSATAVDLGCAYTLHVNSDGSGTLHTTLGWVGFHLNGRDSFIPAGAMCLTRPGIGPDTPYFEDATPQFRDALRGFDTSAPSSDARVQQLSVVLAQARPKDALTLWHLLSRTDSAQRAQVYDRLAVLAPPPNGVTRDGVLSLNPAMLDRYWDALGLGRISVWRMWQQSAAPGS